MYGNANPNDEDKKREKNNTQREIIMVDADFKKFNNEKIRLESELRSLKKDESRIKVEMQDRQLRLGKVSQEVMQLEARQRALKKKLNSL